MSLVIQPVLAASSISLLNAGAHAEAPRTSQLPAPIMLLTGHEGEVSSLDFSKNGEWLCSGSYDRSINIWSIGAECRNTIVLRGHKNAILDVKWSNDGREIYSCSADKNIFVWDVELGVKTARQRKHRACVTCLDVSNGDLQMLVSGDDEGKVYFWDPRQSTSVEPTKIDTQLPITGLQVGNDGTYIYTASVDNCVSVWDVRARRNDAILELQGHNDTIVGLRLSPDGTRLLSNSLDDTLRIWDVRACTGEERCEKILLGAPHDAGRRLVRPCWSSSGRYIACGSGDRSVVVWDSSNGRVLYKLPGHRAAVAAVAWHPNAPIVASGSADRTVYLGELNLRQ